MKKKILIGVCFIGVFIITLMFNVNYVNASCSADHGDGWTSSCDGSNLECCQFHVNGMDYNCDGVYSQTKDSGPQAM